MNKFLKLGLAGMAGAAIVSAGTLTLQAMQADTKPVSSMATETVISENAKLHTSYIEMLEKPAADTQTFQYSGAIPAEQNPDITFVFGITSDEEWEEFQKTLAQEAKQQPDNQREEKSQKAQDEQIVRADLSQEKTEESKDPIEVQTPSPVPADINLSNTEPGIQVQEVPAGTPAAEVIQETPPIDVTDTQSQTRKYVLIGDSRTVGMESMLSDKFYVIAKVGKGYSWMANQADAEIKSHIDNNTTLVFNLGVNDLANADKYISYLQNLQAMYPQMRIVCMTVGPVGKTTVTNDSINAFNQKLRASGFEIMDVNQMLVSNGFNAPDGLHYSQDTYRQINDLINSTVF